MIFDNKKKVESKNNKFLKITSEKDEFNQYWFSEKTIEFILSQCQRNGTKIAFVSTPSLFFSASGELQEKSMLFDYDEIFTKKHKNVSKFDYRQFNEEDLKKQCLFKEFDFVVVDPPFITKEVWTEYAKFIRLIGKEDVKILGSSIEENKNMLNELLKLEIRNYQPSIPNLVYQYNFFSNYDDEELNKENSEIIY
jgi:hypothetical protein